MNRPPKWVESGMRRSLWHSEIAASSLLTALKQSTPEAGFRISAAQLLGVCAGQEGLGGGVSGLLSCLGWLQGAWGLACWVSLVPSEGKMGRKSLIPLPAMGFP